MSPAHFNSCYSKCFSKDRVSRPLPGTLILCLALLLGVWPSHVAKPGCSKWCLTSVFSIGLHRKAVKKYLGFFSLLHKDRECEALTLNMSLIQRVHQNHQKPLPLEATTKTCGPSSEPRPEHGRAHGGTCSRSQDGWWWTWGPPKSADPFLFLLLHSHSLSKWREGQSIPTSSFSLSSFHSLLFFLLLNSLILYICI